MVNTNQTQKAHVTQETLLLSGVKNRENTMTASQPYGDRIT